MSTMDNDPAVDTLLEAMELDQLGYTFLGRRGTSHEYEVWVSNDYDDSLCTFRVVNNGLYNDNCLDGLPAMNSNGKWIMYKTKELNDELVKRGFNRWF